MASNKDRWTPALDAKLSELHKQNLTYDAMTVILGRSIGAIAGRCNFLSLPKRGSRMRSGQARAQSGFRKHKLSIGTSPTQSIQPLVVPLYAVPDEENAMALNCARKAGIEATGIAAIENRFHDQCSYSYGDPVKGPFAFCPNPRKGWSLFCDLDHKVELKKTESVKGDYHNEQTISRSAERDS
jgi:hypothetical protein